MCAHIHIQKKTSVHTHARREILVLRYEHIYVCYLELLYIIILLIWDFFLLALANSFSLESEWLQVSSRLQDSP